MKGGFDLNFKVELSTDVGKEKVTIYSANLCFAEWLNP